MSFQAGIGYAPEWLIWVPCITLTPTVLERGTPETDVLRSRDR